MPHKRQRRTRPKRVVTIDAPDGDHITLYHLHRYFEGCWVKGRLSPVLGNEEIRIAALLNWAVCNNGTLFRGESGSAKTVTSNAISALLYGDEGIDGHTNGLFVVGAGSDKAQFTWQKAQQIARADLCYVPELQNARNYEWLFKLWLEGRNAQYDRAIDGGRDVETFNLNPLPIMTALADGNEDMPDLSNEMKRRFLSFYTRSDEQLNQEVHKMKARLRMAPDEELVTIQPEDQAALRRVIMEAMKEERRVVNPGADVSEAVVPAKYTVSNTFIDYWFDLVEGVTKFYRNARVGDHRYLFSTPGDNYVAFMLVSNVIRDLALGIPPLGNEILSALPMVTDFGGLRSDTRHESRHIDEIVQHLDVDLGIPRSKKIIKDALERLEGAGFVSQDDNKRYYRIKEVEGNGCNVDWSLLIEASIAYMEEKYPQHAEAYKAQAYHYVDPFDGQTKEIPISDKPVKREEVAPSGLRNL